MEILSNGAEIRIIGVEKENEGRYECVSTNIAGSATEIAFLKVSIPPSIKLSPSGSVRVSIACILHVSNWKFKKNRNRTIWKFFWKIIDLEREKN